MCPTASLYTTLQMVLLETKLFNSHQLLKSDGFYVLSVQILKSHDIAKWLVNLQTKAIKIIKLVRAHIILLWIRLAAIKIIFIHFMCYISRIIIWPYFTGENNSIHLENGKPGWSIDLVCLFTFWYFVSHKEVIWGKNCWIHFLHFKLLYTVCA